MQVKVARTWYCVSKVDKDIFNRSAGVQIASTIFIIIIIIIFQCYKVKI
jgi:hypothetical protein